MGQVYVRASRRAKAYVRTSAGHRIRAKFKYKGSVAARTLWVSRRLGSTNSPFNSPARNKSLLKRLAIAQKAYHFNKG